MKKIILLLLFLIIQINCLHFIEDETDENDITSPEYVEKLEETLKKSGILEEETEDNLIEATKDACLVDEKNLADIGISNPDKNQRFIMGKCNPIVFVNGVYASKFSV